MKAKEYAQSLEETLSINAFFEHIRNKFYEDINEEFMRFFIQAVQSETVPMHVCEFVKDLIGDEPVDLISFKSRLFEQRSSAVDVYRKDYMQLEEIYNLYLLYRIKHESAVRDKQINNMLEQLNYVKQLLSDTEQLIKKHLW